MFEKRLNRHLMAASAACLLVSAAGLQAQLPQLWPTFSTPASIVNVDLNGTSASGDDMLAEQTLIGAYNQLQGSARLYLSDTGRTRTGWRR